jgi:hypothetical protein
VPQADHKTLQMSVRLKGTNRTQKEILEPGTGGSRITFQESFVECGSLQIRIRIRKQYASSFNDRGIDHVDCFSQGKKVGFLGGACLWSFSF